MSGHDLVLAWGSSALQYTVSTVCAGLYCTVPFTASIFSERKTLIRSTRQLSPTLNGYCDDDHAETEIKNFIDNERVTMKGASSSPKTSVFDEIVSPFYAVDGSKIDSTLKKISVR
jgi:hypothetical protein